MILQRVERVYLRVFMGMSVLAGVALESRGLAITKKT